MNINLFIIIAAFFSGAIIGAAAMACMAVAAREDIKRLL